MKFGNLLAAMALMGAGLAARIRAESTPLPFQEGLTVPRWTAAGNHRRVAPNPTGALGIRRGAAKRRNKARHRANCRGRRP